MTGLRDELREAAGRAATVAMTRRGEGLPALHWSATPVGYHQWQVTGTVESGTPGPEVLRQVTAWAERLGIPVVDKPQSGIAEAKGDVDDVTVEVWGVLDQATWDAWLRRPAGDL